MYVIFCKVALIVPTRTQSHYSHRILWCLKHQQSACQMRERSIWPVWMKIQRLGERCVWCGNEWLKFSVHHLVFLYLSPPHRVSSSSSSSSSSFFSSSSLVLDQCRRCSSISAHSIMCWNILVWAAVRLFIGLSCSSAAICGSVQAKTRWCCFLFDSSGWGVEFITYLKLNLEREPVDEWSPFKFEHYDL